MQDLRLHLAQIHATQLQAAFERCWNTPSREFDLLSDVSLGIPALICASLSVEIGLKAILRQCGIEPKREHDLAVLLEKLPPDIYAQIKVETLKRFPDFDVQLENAKKAFVDWRYFYEVENDMHINILFVGALGAAVQKAIGLKWTVS